MKQVMLGCHTIGCGKPQDSFGLELCNSVLTQTSEVVHH
jgi:hypothetical protein